MSIHLKLLHLGGIFSLWFILRYDGSLGAAKTPLFKWMFYLYYPFHLTMLALLFRLSA